MTRRHVALRIPQNVLAQIDGLAEDYGLTRTAYMIRASTGELEDPTDLRTEFDAIHHASTGSDGTHSEAKEGSRPALRCRRRHDTNTKRDTYTGGEAGGANTR